ncbi:hypothetical protein LPJ71_007920, partial [Coemansia sp. S17]
HQHHRPFKPTLSVCRHCQPSVQDADRRVVSSSTRGLYKSACKVALCPRGHGHQLQQRV